MWAQHGRANAQQRSTLMRPEQAFDFRTRMRHLPERCLAGLRVRLGRAMKKRRSNARLQQAVDGCIVVGGGSVVVAPVHQRGGAMVQLVEGAHQGGNVQILRGEDRRQAGMHLLEILQQRPVGRHPAQGSLPGVQVRIDQARDDDATGGRHHLGVVRLDARRDLLDQIA